MTSINMRYFNGLRVGAHSGRAPNPDGGRAVRLAGSVAFHTGRRLLGSPRYFGHLLLRVFVFVVEGLQ